MELRRVAYAVLITDLLVLGVATYGAMVLKFGLSTPERTWGPIELTYPQFGVLLAVFWSWMLSVYESRDHRVLGRGFEEFRRIGRATAFTFGLVAMASVVLKLDFSRMYVAVALPLGLLGLVASRYGWRRFRARDAGVFTRPAFIVGDAASAQYMEDLFRRDPGSGFRVVGFWDPLAHEEATDRLVELRKRFEDSAATTLIITASHTLGHRGMRALRWDFEGVEILVSPHFFDVAPGRARLEYAAGETLIHLGEPHFERAGGLLKAAFDRVVAVLLLAVLSPVLIGVALAVKISSPGPVLFRHVRVGRNGRPFSMLKFRSMQDRADEQLQAILQSQGSAKEPLFKPVNDPRITPVGRFIRRLSLDELPQLVNVLNGTMSLVGPRPQVPEEVALYRDFEGARLKVRPGITGLWQVSGRSNLSWQEAVRLDVYYVENWSMLVDLLILWRTIGAVARSEGAR